MKIKKATILIFGIFFLGVFLRFFKIGENLFFSGEQGVEYLEIKSAVLSRRLPLLGPPAAHQFRLGPLYYWLMIPLLVIFNFNPAIGTYLVISASSLIIFLNFFLIKEIFNQRVAFLSSFLIAISPFLIEFSRLGRFYFLVLLPFYLLFWALFKFWQGKGQFLFWAGLAFGVMLNFHLSSLFLLMPVFAILWVKRASLGKKELSSGFLGFLLPNLPFLIYDSTCGLTITSRLLSWIPYRIAGFLGLYPKNNLTPAVLKENLLAFYNFFSQTFAIGPQNLAILIVVGTLLFIILNLKKAFDTKKENFGWFFFFWTLIFGLLALFVHSLPPKHYFLILSPVLIVIFALMLAKIWQSHLKGGLILLVLLVLTFFNFKFFLSSFYRPCESVLCLEFQKKIAKLIIEDAKGEKFSLKRVGEFDYYPGGYAQNYQYLLWRLGNEPSEEKTKLRYTIYEDLGRLPEDIEEKGELLQVGKVLILKEVIR